MTGLRNNKTPISRRRFLQIAAAAGALAGGSYFGLDAVAEKPSVVRQTRVMMGTQINLIVYGPDEAVCRTAVQNTFSRMARVEQVLSRFIVESDLSRLNAQGELHNPAPELLDLLSLARQISSHTDGAFDLTVLPLLELYKHNHLPTQQQINKAMNLTNFSDVQGTDNMVRFARTGMGITADGIGKGYIVDQGVMQLKKDGFDNTYVEAGGDLMVSGNKPGNAPWRIGVRSPRGNAADQVNIIETRKSLAIATSGDYMQYFSKDMRNHHILDPRTGMSPPELASATVTAPTVALADGLATAAMVMGAEKTLLLMERMENCEALLIDKNRQHFKSRGFQA